MSSAFSSPKNVDVDISVEIKAFVIQFAASEKINYPRLMLRKEIQNELILHIMKTSTIAAVEIKRFEC